MTRVVVCGPPGAGKTAWVAARRRRGDLVWDMDAIAKDLFRQPRYPRPPHVVQLLHAVRAQIVKWLVSHPEVSAYIITSDRQDAGMQAVQLRATLIELSEAA